MNDRADADELTQSWAAPPRQQYLRHSESPLGAAREPAHSSVMTQHERLAQRIAPLAVDVLLQGETGVGKDMLARQIHRWSARPGKFVAINCAAIPESLAESELFGHEAGAFTGAVRAREGKLEAADKGTLYLDEIDSMPLAAQAKLLRALQERGAERLGGSRFYRADFRVVASTKVPIAELIAQQRFRMDLYFRLNVVRIMIPSLRESRERIVPLFERFSAEAAERLGLQAQELRVDAAMRVLLQHHPWPGNVRELANAAQRHVLGLPPLDPDLAAIPPAVLAASAGAAPADAPASPEAAGTDSGEPASSSAALRERLRAFERDVIVSTLKRHNGSVARASTELQVPPNTLYYRIKTLGIQFQPE